MSKFQNSGSIFEYRVFSNPKEIRKNTNDRLNEQALIRYVPFFHEGEKVINYVLQLDDVNVDVSSNGSISFPSDEEFESLSDTEVNYFETEIRMRDMSVEKITALAGPLITKEINKLLKNSHLSPDEQIFDVLYYAGIGGLVKGMRHFDPKKIQKSSTNYLFQWITTYAEKELNVIEAPFGIAPSRFKKYKKISAVRKRLTSELERYATNDEVLEYFMSGRADIKTMNGPVKKKVNPDGSGRFKSNQEITIDLIEEQENFELNLNQISNIDTQDEYESSVAVAHDTSESFEDTIFGAFVSEHNITDEAKAVIIAETSASNISQESQDIISQISKSNYHSLKNRWRDLLRDKRGPFYVFLLRTNHRMSASDDYKFDISQTIKSIENYDKEIRPERWLPLFTNKKVEIL